MVGGTVVESQSKCAGTIYDSSGGHVDMWCASLGWLVKDGDERHRFVVIVYDKERTGGEKNKNGNTGRMCLRALVSLLHVCDHYIVYLTPGGRLTLSAANTFKVFCARSFQLPPS